MDVSGITSYLSALPKFLTDKVIDLMSAIGITVSLRWAGLFTLFVTLLIFWMAMKISKPLLKWILILLAIILGLGLIIPSW